MPLRRLRDNLAQQNWTAVALEFVIVVLGVVIGFQITEWNRQRLLNEDYEAARERVLDELRENIRDTSLRIERIDNRMAIVADAFDTLQSCSTEAEALATIESGLSELRSTVTPRLKTEAAEYMVLTPELANTQEEPIRARLRALLYDMREINRDGEISRELVFDDLVDAHPMITFGERREDVQFEREVKLAGTVSRACRDDTLKKHFVTWERSMLINRELARMAVDLLNENLDVLK